jgi:hypothetical protein
MKILMPFSQDYCKDKKNCVAVFAKPKQLTAYLYLNNNDFFW